MCVTDAVYRATFPLSFKEIKNFNKGEGVKVTFGVTVGLVIAVFLASFLRKSGTHSSSIGAWEGQWVDSNKPLTVLYTGVIST